MICINWDYGEQGVKSSGHLSKPHGMNESLTKPWEILFTMSFCDSWFQ